MKGSLVSIAVLLAACSGGYANKPARPAPQSEGGTKATTQSQTVTTTVKVQNESIDDLDVYVLGSGTRTRLGTVRGNSTDVLTIPDDIVRLSPQVRFLLHPIGGQNERTEMITVTPGDQIEMTIPPS
ncbi:MAG TPA: hypothetical protein VKQ05_11085 [Gemmatimonadales bacterium]|nr:hypothetical protein [Gemmatimonadales bacterium]